MDQRSSKCRIGVDVGGTHTDLVVTDIATGALRIKKLPSSPENPANAVSKGLEELIDDGLDPSDIEFFAHGTTVTTNALLEGKGSKVGLLINDGYRAICEVQTQARDEGNPFDHLFSRPPPITPPSLTREIGGRMDYAGVELIPLNGDLVSKSARELAEQGVRSFAVCYLFSFMNDAHERATAKIIRDTVDGAQVSLSSEVLPRIREWPRYSTTLVNAYLVAVLANYISLLSQGLDTRMIKTPRRFLMQSNGGVMPLTANAESQTVHTLLSGPAAGVQGTAYLLGIRQGIKNIVTMDMGGTSCDIAFIQNGSPLEHAQATVAGRIVGVPALDVSTISAGGGSLAFVNPAGLLEVGPKSAGADPGPACYGRGGELPTVTDADLVSGFLNPDFFLGGKMELIRKASIDAVKKHVANPMGADVLTAAEGIVRVINARMADEIRVQAAKKGIDLTDFTLVPFGGAGPVHAAAVAQDLDISRVLVPESPGAFSAFGLLCADVVHDYIRSDLQDLHGLEPAHVEAAFVSLEKKAAVDLRDEGLGEENTQFIREMDLRYAGQGYELCIPLEGLNMPMDKMGLCSIEERFHDRHYTVHGHVARDADVEVVSYRLRAVVPVPKLEIETQDTKATGSKVSVPTGTRELSDGKGKRIEAAIWHRSDFPIGKTLSGPIIVEQIDSTTVVPSGWSVRLDDYSNLALTYQEHD